jgi:hypothetical protein
MVVSTAKSRAVVNDWIVTSRRFELRHSPVLSDERKHLGNCKDRDLGVPF